MTTEPLGSRRHMRQRMAEMADALRCASTRAGAAPATRTRLMSVTLLAIESSCDETSVAVVTDGRRIHVQRGREPGRAARSDRGHRARGRGACPPALDDAGARGGLRRAGVADLRDLDGIAVTEGPGLAGSLLVGITMARTLAWDTGLPLVPVNHLEGHIRAAWLLDPDEPDTARARAAPGGARRQRRPHVPRGVQTDELSYRLLGQTVDDAAGEAFDKVGRLLGLPYPGGPSIMAAAAGGHPPRPSPARGHGWATRGDFSFSGLKTAVRRMVTDELLAMGALDDRRGAGWRSPAGGDRVAEIAWAFQDSVVDVLATKTLRAAAAAGARTVVRGRRGRGQRRAARADRGRARRSWGCPLVVPRPALCTDNGAMIGAAGLPALPRRHARGPRRGGAAVVEARPARDGVTGAAPRPARGRRPALDELDPAHLGPEAVERYLRRHGLRCPEAAEPEPPRRWRGARGDHRGVRRRAGRTRCWRSDRASAS